MVMMSAAAIMTCHVVATLWRRVDLLRHSVPGTASRLRSPSHHGPAQLGAVNTCTVLGLYSANVLYEHSAVLCFFTRGGAVG
jgi:hypothetical protein